MRAHPCKVTPHRAEVLRRIAQGRPAFAAPSALAMVRAQRGRMLSVLYAARFIERGKWGPVVTTAGRDALVAFQAAQTKRRAAEIERARLYGLVRAIDHAPTVAAVAGAKIARIHSARRRLGLAKERAWSGPYSPRERDTVLRLHREYGYEALSERFGRSRLALKTFVYRARKAVDAQKTGE